MSTTLHATETKRQQRHTLPTRVRPIVDASAVEVPEGYTIEPLVMGLSFPACLGVAEDGTLFIGEGGSTWPTRPYLPARILTLSPDGHLDVFATEPSFAGPRGFAIRDGSLYLSTKGGYFARIIQYDLRSKKRNVLIDQIPSGGWHEPGGPLFGPDGLMYFAHGSISLQGTVSPAGFTVDIAKHPNAHDVPGQDVTLTGNNVWSRDPRAAYPFLAQTGPFKPFGTPAQKGEIVKGHKFCSTGVWRCKPDGSDVELIAWGIRNPFGMAFNEDGELYISDNDMEEKGERSVAQDPDRIWHIPKAKTPHGSVTTPDWYGFPDYCADGLPVWHESHRPERGTPAEPLLQDPPPFAGPAAVLFEPHTGMGKLEFCRSNAFGPGQRGKLFQCLFGTYAPLNSPRPEHRNLGFSVVSVDVHTKKIEPFVRNKQPGPASAHPGSGGIERPVDCKFSPDGRSLYILDFGVNAVDEIHAVAHGHTGVLWRVTRL